MRTILYVLALLLSASQILADTYDHKAAATVAVARAKLAMQAPIPAQAPPIKQAEPDCHDHGWTDAGNGYQRHSSGYLYHPTHGVYWPQPVASPQPMPIYQTFGFRGGFAGNCGPSG